LSARQWASAILKINLFPLLFRKEAGQENRELDENLDKIWRNCR